MTISIKSTNQHIYLSLENNIIFIVFLKTKQKFGCKIYYLTNILKMRRFKKKNYRSNVWHPLFLSVISQKSRERVSHGSNVPLLVRVGTTSNNVHLIIAE